MEIGARGRASSDEVAQDRKQEKANAVQSEVVRAAMRAAEGLEKKLSKPREAPPMDQPSTSTQQLPPNQPPNSAHQSTKAKDTCYQGTAQGLAQAAQRRGVAAAIMQAVRKHDPGSPNQIGDLTIAAGARVGPKVWVKGATDPHLVASGLPSAQNAGRGALARGRTEEEA